MVFDHCALLALYLLFSKRSIVSLSFKAYVLAKGLSLSQLYEKGFNLCLLFNQWLGIKAASSNPGCEGLIEFIKFLFTIPYGDGGLLAFAITFA